MEAGSQAKRSQCHMTIQHHVIMCTQTVHALMYMYANSLSFCVTPTLSDADEGSSYQPTCLVFQTFGWWFNKEPRVMQLCHTSFFNKFL